jgi:hypothetical protein
MQDARFARIYFRLCGNTQCGPRGFNCPSDPRICLVSGALEYRDLIVDAALVFAYHEKCNAGPIPAAIKERAEKSLRMAGPSTAAGAQRDVKALITKLGVTSFCTEYERDITAGENLVVSRRENRGSGAISPQAAERGGRTPEQACQAQALASIAEKWQNVFKGQFEIILKDNRCLVFLQAPSAVSPGKRTAWLIDGKTGELLAEFYAPTTGGAWKDSDRGLCSYRGGKFPTAECTWDEYLDKANQM